MHNIIRRLRDKRGETLIESMASILIFTFASIIMLTMISTATDINRTAKKADRDHFSQMIIAEMAEGSSTAKGTVKFTVNGVTESVQVDVYGENTDLYSYFVSETQPSAGGAG